MCNKVTLAFDDSQRRIKLDQQIAEFTKIAEEEKERKKKEQEEKEIEKLIQAQLKVGERIEKRKQEEKEALEKMKGKAEVQRVHDNIVPRGQCTGIVRREKFDRRGQREQLGGIVQRRGSSEITREDQLAVESRRKRVLQQKEKSSKNKAMTIKENEERILDYIVGAEQQNSESKVLEKVTGKKESGEGKKITIKEMKEKLLSLVVSKGE